MTTRMRPILTAAIVVIAGCAPAVVSAPPSPHELREDELRSHLFAFAHDSMLGRRAGAEGGVKAARYIAGRLAAAGLQPAGEDGSFYQTIPLARITVDVASSLDVDGEPLRYGRDFVVGAPRWRTAAISDAPVVFLGTSATDTSGWPAREALRGRAVLFDRTGAPSSSPGTAPARYLAGAAAILVATDLESLSTFASSPATTLSPGALPAEMPADPATVYLSPRAAQLALGTPVSGARVGAPGGRVTARIVRSEQPLPAHNIVAVLPGSGPALRDEYVVLSAHPDHVGTRQSPLDHDSLRAVLLEAERRGWALGRRLTASERAQIHVATDTLVRSGPVRADSVFNGADDDGSGSMLLLTLAESFARSGVRPARSILFVWTHAEELGLLGSRYFTDHPTVPRGAMIANINLDMVGRGGVDDIPGGGPRFLRIVGSRRLSSELGDLVETVNSRLAEPMQLDYAYDTPGHPERIYCRSDHANFARYGIPVVFFTTGLHADYHQLTDEPQYIDYAKLRRVGALAGSLALELANAPRRPVVDAPAPDPFAPCVQ